MSSKHGEHVHSHSPVSERSRSTWLGFVSFQWKAKYPQISKNLNASLPRLRTLPEPGSGVSGDVVSAPSSTSWIWWRVTGNRKWEKFSHIFLFLSERKPEEEQDQTGSFSQTQPPQGLAFCRLWHHQHGDCHTSSHVALHVKLFIVKTAIMIMCPVSLHHDTAQEALNSHLGGCVHKHTPTHAGMQQFEKSKTRSGWGWRKISEGPLCAWGFTPSCWWARVLTNVAEKAGKTETISALKCLKFSFATVLQELHVGVYRTHSCWPIPDKYCAGHSRGKYQPPHKQTASDKRKKHHTNNKHLEGEEWQQQLWSTERFSRYLWLSHKYPTILLAGEIALSLHGAVVLALGLVQDDSHPFPGSKERVADVGHRAALPLPDHLHQGAHFDGPPAPVWAHPAAAAAGGLSGTDR